MQTAVSVTDARHPAMAISTDKACLDVDAIHEFLRGCYWSPGIARERVERAIEHSLCFGLYDQALRRGGGTASAPVAGHQGNPVQAGFARVVTDHASFAYLCDVFVLDAYRGRGLAKWLMEVVIATPSLQGIRRFCLMTRDAHGVYERFGFKPMSDPTKYLELVDREGYRRP